VVGAHGTVAVTAVAREGAVEERQQLAVKSIWVGCATSKSKADLQPGTMKVKKKEVVVE